ncbi:MAG: hypothetical protein L0Y71_12160 [Gemmataceae bacterium]|nr:hypothetical protein [Gemmataceae bacterium]
MSGQGSGFRSQGDHFSLDLATDYGLLTTDSLQYETPAAMADGAAVLSEIFVVFRGAAAGSWFFRAFFAENGRKPAFFKEISLTFAGAGPSLLD